MELPESRLDSLYKDFAYLEELNPEGYRANINTWRSYLTKNYLEGSKSLFLNCGSDLLNRLRREPQGLPRSIDLVLDSLVESGHLVSYDDFCKGTMYPQEGFFLLRWMGWGSRSTKKRNLRRNHAEQYLKDVKFVIKSVIEEKSKHIKSQLQNNILSEATGIADLVFSRQEFYRKCGFHRILNDSEDERDAMIFYLSHYEKLIVRDGDVVKVVAPDVDPLLADFQRTVTEDDQRIVTLKSSLRYLESQIKTLRSQISDYASSLRDSIINSASRETQRNYLLGKKMVERNLNNLLNQQTSLMNLKTQLNMAATNAVLFKTLEDSSKLIKSINNSAGSVERVEELLDEIREQGDRAEEINDLLAKSPDIDESEIEKELKDMEAEEIKKREKPKISVGERKENEAVERESKIVMEKLSGLHIDSESIGPRKKDPNSIKHEESEPIAES